MDFEIIYTLAAGPGRYYCVVEDNKTGEFSCMKIKGKKEKDKKIYSRYWKPDTYTYGRVQKIVSVDLDEITRFLKGRRANKVSVGQFSKVFPNLISYLAIARI